MESCTINDGIYIGTQFVLYSMVNAFKLALEQANEMALFVQTVRDYFGLPYYTKIPFTNFGIEVITAQETFIDPELLKPDKYWKVRYSLFGWCPLGEQIFYKRNQATYAQSLIQPNDYYIYSDKFGKQTGVDQNGLPTWSQGNYYGLITDTANLYAFFKIVTLFYKLIKRCGLKSTIAKFVSLITNFIYRNTVKDALDDIQTKVTDLDTKIIDVDGDVAEVKTLIVANLSQLNAQRILR